MSSKKIVIFITSLTAGGAQRVTVALSTYLVRHGHEVTVVTMQHAEQDYYSLDTRCRRICLELAGDTKGFDKLLANVKRTQALRDVIKAECPDIIIGMMTSSAVLAIFACAGLSTKVIASERTNPARGKISRQWKILRKLVYRFADAHVAQTDQTASWLRSHTGAQQVVVIPNSIRWPVQSYPPTLNPNDLLGQDKKLILAVGRLVPVKGFDLLVRAFALAGANLPEWHLVILGSNDSVSNASYYKKLVDMTHQLDMTERVHFPGHVGNVADWYKRADLFVLSSRYEGFPNVLLEAMASGCPSIAFDCDTGPRDVIRTGINGVLISPENISDLALSMQQLMQDPTYRKEIALASVDVRDRFSEENILSGWVNLLEKL